MVLRPGADFGEPRLGTRQPLASDLQALHAPLDFFQRCIDRGERFDCLPGAVGSRSHDFHLPLQPGDGSADFGNPGPHARHRLLHRSQVVVQRVHVPALVAQLGDLQLHLGADLFGTRQFLLHFRQFGAPGHQVPDRFIEAVRRRRDARDALLQAGTGAAHLIKLLANSSGRAVFRPDPPHLGGHCAGTLLQCVHGLRLARDPLGELLRFPGTRVKMVLHVPDPFEQFLAGLEVGLQFDSQVMDCRGVLFDGFGQPLGDPVSVALGLAERPAPEVEVSVGEQHGRHYQQRGQIPQQEHGVSPSPTRRDRD